MSGRAGEEGAAYSLHLRLWIEPSAGAPEWRGELRDLVGGRRRVFRGLEALEPTVRAMVAAIDDDAEAS